MLHSKLRRNQQFDVFRGLIAYSRIPYFANLLLPLGFVYHFCFNATGTCYFNATLYSVAHMVPCLYRSPNGWGRYSPARLWSGRRRLRQRLPPSAVNTTCRAPAGRSATAPSWRPTQTVLRTQPPTHRNTDLRSQVNSLLTRYATPRHGTCGGKGQVPRRGVA